MKKSKKEKKAVDKPSNPEPLRRSKRTKKSDTQSEHDTEMSGTDTERDRLISKCPKKKQKGTKSVSIRKFLSLF